ncbi:hypothetical protein VNI00_005757 [Paramarasmius palmivorus]|uniref:Uncharacterized protein n=1 Tax=Paramarasmius palmivorus TaxID=297713 RepID=A0AAW0DAX6_9AGAR
MADEYADILGAETLPIGPKRAGSWSSLSFPIKFALALGFCLTSYVVLARLWDLFWRWREKEYKLSMRRKYGIPDNDHRPFNVAYAAAQLAREEQDQRKARRRRVEQAVSSSLDQRNAPPEQVRHRPAAQHASSTRSTAVLPGQYDPTYADSIPSAPSTSYSHLSPHPAHPNRVTFADGYNTSASPLDIHAELAPLPSSSGSRRVSDRKSLGILKSSNNSNYINDDRRKRAFGGEGYDHSDDEENDPKKTRVEGDEFIDGDEEPEWENTYSYGGASSSRGPKRSYEDEGRQREKRQRKVSNDGMDVDDEEIDGVGELVRVPSSRGKKRDRAEAGSSFGGDEEDENVEQDTEEYGHKSRHRKRRNKRRSDAHLSSSSRGRKRDRDVDDENGDSSDSSEGSLDITSRRISKKKRGKKSQRSEEERLSDVSMDDSQTGRTTVKGRKIGEEWTSNGVTYKIGQNGQRLRETLLKKARQRFIMPEDSVHPDRSAVHDVYVEAWLTDEQYQAAAAQGILYQSSKDSQTASPTETPATTPPPVKGKHLLWESTISHAPATQNTNPFETSPRKSNTANGTGALVRSITAAGQPASPFPKNGRISSSFRGSVTVDTNSAPPSPGLADSTNSLNSPRIGRYRQYSKWEKQDLEAKAMMRMREANDKKKQEEERLERERKEKEAKEKAPTLPTISVTKPPEDQTKEKEAPKMPTFSLGGATSSTPAAPSVPKLSFGPPATSATDDKSKAATPTPPFSLTPTPSSATPNPAPVSPQPKTSFSFGPSAATSSAPAATTPSAPTATPAAAAAATPSGFSFAKPAAAVAEGPKPSIGLGFPSSAPSQPNSGTTPTTTVPNFFGPPKTGSDARPEQKKDNAGGSSSLLSRINPAEASFKPQPQPLQSGAPTNSTSAPVFSFAKPAAPVSAPSSSTNVNQQPSTESAAAPAPLKFSFAAKGPTSGASTPATTSTTPAPTAEPKPASPFGFKPTESSATSSNPTAGATNGLKFSFGNPSNNSTAAPAPAPAARPAFPAFGSSSGPSPFGGSFTPASTPSGATTTASTFGSAFGGGKDKEAGSDKPVEQPKSVFGGATSSTPSPFGITGSSAPGIFGTKAPTTTTGSSTNTETKSSPFGTPNGASTGAFSFNKPSESSKSAFGAPFGNNAATSTTTGASTSAPTPSPFGGFGSTSTSTGSNIFGTKPADGGKSKFSFGGAAAGASSSTNTSTEAPKSSFPSSSSTTPATGTPSFSFGATPSATSSSTPAAGGNFPFAPNANPSPFGGGSTFGTSAFGGANTSNGTSSSGNPFSFGSSNGTGSQQSK